MTGLRWLFAAAAVLGSALLPSLAEDQEHRAFIAPGVAPARWSRYATALQAAVKAALERDPVLQKHLQEQPERTEELVELGVWVTPKGSISRVVLDRRTDAARDRAISLAIRAIHLTDKPPHDILLPIHLRLHLKPGSPDPTPSAASGPK